MVLKIAQTESAFLEMRLHLERLNDCRSVENCASQQGSYFQVSSQIEDFGIFKEQPILLLRFFQAVLQFCHLQSWKSRTPPFQTQFYLCRT